MVNNKIIGPNSIINFDFNQKEINSKIDNGAETNSLHSNNFLVDVSKPYTELKEEKYLVRTFNENIDSEELVWHRDMEDRIVKSLGDTDWMIQMDNELPRPLTEMVYIPKNTYHRVIKGTGDLKVRVNKLTEISNPSKEVRNIIDITENKINEAVDAKFVKDFLIDFGALMSLNFSQITKMGKDEKATNELKAMMERIRKPIINGQTYFEIIKDNINTIPNNPKLLSAILSQVKNFIEYIEPRVERFVKDGPATNGVNYKESWLGRIKKIKEDYIKIVS